jgi:hypothetical protein
MQRWEKPDYAPASGIGKEGPGRHEIVKRGARIDTKLRLAYFA